MNVSIYVNQHLIVFTSEPFPFFSAIQCCIFCEIWKVSKHLHRFGQSTMTQQLICFWSGMNSEEQFHAFTFSPREHSREGIHRYPSSYGMLNLGFYNSFREFVGFCFLFLSISENKQNGMGATSNSRLTKVANDPITL